MSYKPDHREFQLFVKPIGALCNLGCKYCYYLDKQDLYDEKSAVMSDELLEKYIIQHLEASTEEPVLFSWHGGEPTLAGPDFYRKAVALQKKNNPHKKNILNGIQTNGVNLDDDWCRFLANENFLVGISIDGPENMHNKYRISKSGEDTFQKVMKGYKLLKKHRINSEILCVVNAYNVNFPIEIYNFFRSLGTEYMSFLPLVNHDSNYDTGVTPDSVPAKAFGDFMIAVFDEWQENDIGKIKIQLFEEAFRTAFKQEHTLCIFKKTCGGVPVMERNGDVYSCDHFVNHDHLLGNINQKHLTALLDHPKQVTFGQAKFNTLPGYCLKCEVLEMCNGECPKNRFIKSSEGENGLNYLCEGYKKFFTHCTPFIDAIAEVWKTQA
ncbi:MAG: anaerobic sulfatase maturase [Bacteroidia bacterium]|nr:anaerobic sulfatase maturase [Bacteroidia bacterium]